MSPEQMETIYSSHFFLESKRLRASLALMFDKIHIPSLIRESFPPSLTGILDNGHVEIDEYEYDGSPRPLQLLLLLEPESDGLLGEEGIIQRSTLSYPSSPPTFETRPFDDPILDNKDEEWYIPQWLLWCKRKAPKEFVTVSDRIYERCSEFFIKKHLLIPSGYVHAKIIMALATYWGESIIPRFFDEDTILSSPISVEDMAFLIHQSVLQFFLPDLGELEDEQILELREKTAPERIQYSAHVLTLVNDYDKARYEEQPEKLRKIIQDRIKTRIVPSFIEYTKSLEILSQIKHVKNLDHVIKALRVEGSVFEPRFWIGAAQILRGIAQNTSENRLKDSTNQKRFLAYITKLNQWSRNKPLIDSHHLRKIQGK